MNADSRSTMKSLHAAFFDPQRDDAVFKVTASTATGPVLVGAEGPAKDMIFPLDISLVRIGRSEQNDVVLQDNSVSRFHAEIFFEKGRFFVEDKESTNGTFLEDQKVTKQVLNKGSVISFGRVDLKFLYKELEISQKERLDLLNRSELTKALDAETKKGLSRKMNLQFFPKDSCVLHKHESVESVYFVASGKIRIVEINDEGGQRLIRELESGDTFGEQSLLPGQILPWDLMADSPVWILELPQDKLNEFAQSKPDVQNKVALTIQKYLSTGVYSLERRETISPSVKQDKVELVGNNRTFLAAKKQAEQLVAEGRTPLIVGQSGTGKKILAQHCIQGGPSADKPSLQLSLSELDPLNMEGAIFGVDAGSDGGHIKSKQGYLEILNGGTLVISHAELLGAHLQSKLVTYLKRGWFHKQYGQVSIESSTKLILLLCADKSETTQLLIPELQAELEKSVVVLPPLAKRLKDIPDLAEYFLKKYAKKSAKKVTGLSPEATERLVTYRWPGNISELEVVIQRAVSVSTESTIIAGDLIFVPSREQDFHKLNLLRNEAFRDFIRKPIVFKSVMWLNIVVMCGVAAAAIAGGLSGQDHYLREAETNPGMLITWLIWFPLLPISAFLIGRIWCGICPIAGIGDLFSKIIKFNLPVPKIFRRLDFWLVIVSFLFLDYIEEFIEVTHEPLATGLLLVAIISISVIFCILYERKTFCRYLCPLAGLLGTYSTMSPVEVRGNRKVCQTQCGEHSCFKGTDASPGCPLFSYPASINTNAECMMCGNCLRNCNNRGVQVNLRPPFQELWRRMEPVVSISLFGVILVGMMARHQFSELSWWKATAANISLPEDAIYTLLYFGFIVLALIPFMVSSMLSAAASRETITQNMAKYGMAFIPLALAGHIAHVTHEFVGEGIYNLIAYVRKLWDALISGISMAESQVVVSEFIHHQVTTLLKFMLIFGGFAASVLAMVMIARQAGKQAVMARSFPHLITLLIFGVAYFEIFMA